MSIVNFQHCIARFAQRERRCDASDIAGEGPEIDVSRAKERFRQLVCERLYLNDVTVAFVVPPVQGDADIVSIPPREPFVQQCLYHRRRRILRSDKVEAGLPIFVMGVEQFLQFLKFRVVVHEQI